MNRYYYYRGSKQDKDLELMCGGRIDIARIEEEGWVPCSESLYTEKMNDWRSLHPIPVNETRLTIDDKIHNLLILLGNNREETHNEIMEVMQDHLSTYHPNP